MLKLRWIFRADVDGLTKKVLGVLDASHLAIDSLIPIARVDDDGANNQPCRFQQLMTAVGQICHDLRRRDVLWVFAQIEKFAQLKMRRKTGSPA